MMHVFLILAALLVDLRIGDPPGIPHPVVLMGKVVGWMEGVVRGTFIRPWGLRLGGVLIVVTLVVGSYLAAWVIIKGFSLIHPSLGWIVHLWLLSTALAVKSLRDHALAVADALDAGDLPGARSKLALIVGRDTKNLTSEETVRGAMECVAESTVDGITAPLFYAFIGGAPLALAYKAVNTLDSMLGYRNTRYRHLGWAAARLDDVANYLPARLTGLLFLILAPLTPGGLKNCFKTMLRDGRKHPSPNSGITEAAMAGALGVRLGGTNYYGGVASERPYLGESGEPLRTVHVRSSLRLAWWVTVLGTILGIGLTFLVSEIFQPIF